MTEDEAKTKYCHKRFFDFPPPGGHAMTIEHGVKCIGSQCMAWRWLNEKTKAGSCGLVRL